MNTLGYGYMHSFQFQIASETGICLVLPASMMITVAAVSLYRVVTRTGKRAIVAEKRMNDVQTRPMLAGQAGEVILRSCSLSSANNLEEGHQHVN